MFKNTNILKKYWPILIIVLLWLGIVMANYTPGTWLTGWDTLHPEFNFPLNFQRLIFGVWRHDQGLGAVAAHTHMSELPRVFILWLLSWVLPLNIIRYSYVFLCLLAGVLGTYFLSFYLLGNKTKLKFQIYALVGALFYLFNLGTVQHFYVPFEMFCVQYAALGWLFLLVTKYLKKRKKTDLILLTAVTLLATPMAYAFVLWYAYFIALVLYLAAYYFLNRQKQVWLAVKKILVITLLVNAFWLLPNLYFIASHAQEVSQAKTNRLFSQEAYLHNQAYGHLKDAAIFKNFLFNWQDFNGNKFENLLGVWQQHIDNLPIGLIGYFFSCLIMLGIIVTIVKKKKQWLPFLPIGLLALLMLLQATWPINFIFSWLRDQNEIFKEGLRFPFTKFSLLLMMFASLYLVVALQFLDQLLVKFVKTKTKYLTIILGCFLSLLLFIYAWPMFKGYLINPHLRIKIPEKYFQLFDWFDKQNSNSRIAPLPIHSFWGWEYYDWGYQGAGFLWFDLKQPFLARDFDRWNPTNEQFYREMSGAIYAQDENLVEAILDKYQIKWLLVDKSVISPDSKTKALFLNEIDQTLTKSVKIKLVKKFGDQIFVYEKQTPTQTQDWFSSPKSLIRVEPLLSGDWVDQTYLDLGDYYLAVGADVIYPWRMIVGNDESLTGLSINPVDNILNLQIKGNNFIDYDLLLPRFEPQTIIPTKFKLDIEQPRLILSSPWLSQSPTIVNQNLTNKRLGFLVFNQKDVVAAELINESKANLKTGINNVTFFDNQNINTGISLQNLEFNPRKCGDLRTPATFGANIVGQNSLELELDEGVMCVDFDINHLLSNPKDTIIKLNFQSQGDIEACLFNFRTQNCQDMDKISGFSQDWLGFIPEIDWLDTTVRFQITADKEEISQHYIKNLEISLYSNQLNQQNFNLSLNPEIIASLNENALELEIPIDENEVILNKQVQRLESCGKPNPTLTLRENESDYVPFNSMTHDQGKLLVIESLHLSGLPTKICVANQTTSKCDLQTVLHSQPSWQKEFFIIPSSYDGGEGYDVHLQTMSIGQVLSQNNIRSIVIINIPTDWLRSIVLTKQTDQNFSELEINEVKDWGDFFYRVKGVPQANSSFLIFNKSYESGWLAFSNGQFLPHVKVNNWANGWEIDKNEGETIYIFFWPQLLEFIGFGLLIGVGVWLVLYRRKKN